MTDLNTRPSPENFPTITRDRLEILQVNLGYLCNLSCRHCHVNAGPKRTELMDHKTITTIISVLKESHIKILDLTGGAPEMHPQFRFLVSTAKALGITVIDRCNLVILEEPDYENLAAFLADQAIEITASLPCYLEDNVNAQRGKGVFNHSITALQKLNALGYGQANNTLKLNLVYNPQGPTLPPEQSTLENAYKKHLKEHFNIVFDQLFVVTNMPINRFRNTLKQQNKLADYQQLLKDHYQHDTLASLMCKKTLSVDWQGFLYDCDFNQMLKYPLGAVQHSPCHITDIDIHALDQQPITVAEHCFGCTAGQGSSCGGALK
ncbi:MAG: arsenosugar biosynthesis radical SAM protein ArsS [Methylococcales bacterium]|jgi:radical SAM/Cys-rich protein|nr:arsenosugar biosynthesis radical SAM protein ArsS [Methylococcales bacterium]